MESEKLAQVIRSKIRDEGADVKTLLNSQQLAESHGATQAALESLVDDLNSRIRSHRHDTSSEALLNRVRELGAYNQRLDKRLHAHIQMLRRNGSLASTADVLEFDLAKSRSDRLVEVINAKNKWASALRAVDMMDESEQNELYTHLVALQQANCVLSQYIPCSQREKIVESRKDLFFGWLSPAILFSIDNQDVSQLKVLKEKYEALGRATEYKQVFGAYVRNKISTWMTSNEAELTLWSLLSQFFTTWKQCQRIASQMLGAEGSAFMAQSGYDGMHTKDETIRAVIERLMISSEDAFAAAHEIAKIRSEFIAYVKSEGDDAVVEISNRFCDDLFELITDDYAKHVKSTLSTKVDRIAQAAKEKNPRKHEWAVPMFEEVNATFRKVVNEAASSCGPNFSRYIVPSFEKTITLLNSTLRKSHVLLTKASTESSAIQQAAPSLDALGDKLVCISAAGYLVNMVEDLNNFIQETHDSLQTADQPAREPLLIKDRAQVGLYVNRQLRDSKLQLESHVKKVVKEKLGALAAALADPMTSEMLAVKQAATTTDSMDAMRLALPNFSVSAHNYITVVGHGLLHKMNTIGAYNTDRNFRAAIMITAGHSISEEECDLWALRYIVNIIMSRYVQNIGDVTKLPPKVVKQFHADTIFLMEALHDLRLEPTSELMALGDKLHTASK